jgi:hypothetical protein
LQGEKSFSGWRETIMLPNFLIIGVPRAGTTSTYQGLKQHPQIFLSPIKEPMFFILEGKRGAFPGPFNPTGPRDINGYLSLFQSVKREKVAGESSPYYLFNSEAPLRIKKYLTGVNFIAIFRNPVDRAYSHFLLNRMEGTESITDLEDAMDAEKDRISKGWFPSCCYCGVGYYGQQIERYYSHFERRQFKFFLFEDLLNNPKSYFAEIFHFLGVDETVPISLTEKYNRSGVPRNKILHNFLAKPNFIKNQLKRVIPAETQYRLLTRFMNRNLGTVALSAEVRSRMLAIYREDILKTQDLIQRDLSSWLKQ